MIGSYGKDRAEASGELVPPQRPTARAETSRELVTILPRKQTREIPVVEASTAPPASAEEAPLLPPPRIVSVAGGVTRESGPGLLAKILLAVSAMLTTIAIFKLCSKHAPATQPARVADARATEVAPTPTPLPPPAVMIDAAVAAASVDAAPARPDAGIRRNPPPEPDVVPDKVKQARDLQEPARRSAERGTLDDALSLVEQSIALRKTAHAYLERARVLQKLGRLKDALASIDLAMSIVKDYPPAWALRGKMLHDAHDDENAFPALKRYLELDPNGRDAKEARAILEKSQ